MNARNVPRSRSMSKPFSTFCAPLFSHCFLYVKTCISIPFPLSLSTPKLWAESPLEWVRQALPERVQVAKDLHRSLDSSLLVRSSSKCRVIGASVAILARRSKQANLHDSSMQTNTARSRRNPPGRYRFAMTALEEETSTRIAEQLRALGLSATTRVGRTSVVAVLENGEDNTLSVRVDRDGPAVTGETRLENASRVQVRAKRRALVGGEEAGRIGQEGAQLPCRS